MHFDHKKPLDPKDNPEKDPDPANQIPGEQKDPKKYC